MTAREEARERARLLIAWADEKTLQYRLVSVWTDYDGIESPRISHISEWRIKPRRMWTSLTRMTNDELLAKTWGRDGQEIIEWQEVVK